MNGERYDFSFLEGWKPQVPNAALLGEQKPPGQFDFSFLEGWTPPRPGAEREPIELEKKPGLGFVIGETLKGTGAGIKKTLQSFVKQTGPYIVTQGLKKAAERVREPEFKEAITAEPGKEVSKEISETLAGIIRSVPGTTKGLALFGLQTARNLYKDPYKQITEDPLGTLFFLSIVLGGLGKGIEATSGFGKVLTAQDLTSAFTEAAKVAPEFRITPEMMTKQLVDSYNKSLGDFLRMRELPQMTPQPSFLATEKGTVMRPETPEAVSILARYREAEGVKPGMEINIKPEADGSITVSTKPKAELFGAKEVEYPAGFNVKGERKVSEIYGAMQGFKALTEDGWVIDYNPETRIATVAGKRGVNEGMVTERGKVVWSPKPTVEAPKIEEKPTVVAPAVETPKAVAAAPAIKPKARKPPQFKNPLLQAIDEIGGIKPNADYPAKELRRLVPPSLVRSRGMPMDELAAELDSKGFRFRNDGELYDQLSRRKVETGEFTEEEWRRLKEEQAEAEAEAAKEEPEILYRKPPTLQGKLKLYRVESEPSLGPGLPEWMKPDPLSGVRGRYFTNTKENLDWYIEDLPEGTKYRIKMIELSPEEAEPYRVSNVPEAQRFSKDPTTEFFLPPNIASKGVIQEAALKPAVPPTEKPPTAAGRAVARPGREIEGGVATPLVTPEGKAKIGAKTEVKVEPEGERIRLDEIERGIEDAILNRRELTPDQKAYLEERQSYKAYESTERPSEPTEVVTEETAPRERLVKVTIKTPSGDFVQETMESSVSKIQDYARRLKVEDRVKIGEPYGGRWKEYLPPSEIDKLLRDVMRDVKTISPEKWEKYAGYPFLPEIKRVFTELKSRQAIKRLVTREEIRRRLAETPEGKVEWMYLETERLLREKAKPTWRKAFEGAKRAVTDTSGNIKAKLLREVGDEGRKAVIEHDLIAGATAKSERWFTRAEKEIFSGLSKEEEGLLNRAIQSRRTVAVSAYKPEMRHPMGLSKTEHEAFLSRNIPEKIQQKADLYFGEMRRNLDRLHEEGLLNEEAYNDLASKGDYSPRRFIQYIDPENTYTISGKTITVPDSGIKALDEGSYRVMEIDSRRLLADVISRTEGRIFRNNANKALYELADKVPGNGIVEKAEVYKVSESGRPTYETAKGGYTKLRVVIDGQTKDMIMPDEFAREWITKDPLVNHQIANLAGWLSGSKILKPLATGINPGFAITNMPRDILHIWTTTNEYSSFFPKFGFQMARDFMSVAKDAITRGRRWRDYIDEGGGMNFLTYQGRPFPTSLKGLNALQKVLGYVGETSEIWSRLALRERALRNGKAPTEATWIARNYLDFNQGGNVIKALDTGIPYLNASIQATRGLFRAVADRPAQTIWKVAQLGTLASGLYLANRFGNKDCWEATPDREKINNFIITTPFHVRDKNGNERHFYFKIAKDQTQRVFCSIFENLMAKALGEKVNVDQITGAVSDFIPIVPEQNIPPTIDAFLGYMANKDFWRMEDIWKGPKVRPREEYTAYTDPAIREAGKLLNLSPERLQYALSQIFTRGNIYTALVSGGLNAVLSDTSEADKRKITAELITKAVPDIKRVFNLTPPYSQTEIKEAKEAALEDATIRFKQERELNEKAAKFYRKLYDENVRDEKLLGEIRDFIRKQPGEDKDRLIRWFKNYGKVYDIPDRSWWLTLSSMPPETRATVFWNKYLESTEEERQEMMRLARQVPEVMSDRFKRRLGLLLAKLENENK